MAAYLKEEIPVAIRTTAELQRLSELTITNGGHLLISGLGDYDDESTALYGTVDTRAEAVMSLREWINFLNGSCPAFDKSSQGNFKGLQDATKTLSVVIGRCKTNCGGHVVTEVQRR